MPLHNHSNSHDQDQQQLIGKKQLLAWASTCTNIDCNKYDDLRDGLIPLVIFRNLFPNGIPAEIAVSIRSQLNMVSSQRPARQNWMVLSQLMKHGGIPHNVWDRRSVSASHPKACYNFLVLGYFLHKLRAGGEFSVDFALPVDVELSNFLQSTKSLDVVNRAPMLQPISYKLAASGNHTTASGNTSRSASANRRSPSQNRRPNTPSNSVHFDPSSFHHHQQNDDDDVVVGTNNNTGDQNRYHYYADSSADDKNEFAVSTPRLGGSNNNNNNTHQNRQQQQQQYNIESPNRRNKQNNNNTASEFSDGFGNNNNFFSPPSSQLQHIAAQSAAAAQKQSSSTPTKGRNIHQHSSGNGGAVLVSLEDNTGSGWRYGLDTSHLGEGMIQKLKGENAKLHDAVVLANDHVQASQRYCESQIQFAKNQFLAEIKKIQLEAQLTKMQQESQHAVTVSMIQSSAEARIRDIERRIVAERRESNWGVFADDPIPDDCAHPQRWLSAQLDASRKEASNERQHRIALENENAMLKEKNAKFMPMMENLTSELNEALERLDNCIDPDRVIEKTNESLDKLKQLSAVEYETKIETLEVELEAAKTRLNSIENVTTTNNTESIGLSSSSSEAIYKLQEQLVMTREQLARAENSSSLLRELLHKNCTTPMQKLDLSAFTLDPKSDELRRGVMTYSSMLGTNSSQFDENSAAIHVRHITDIVSAIGGDKISDDEFQKIRDGALRFALMHQILEARVQSMSQNLVQVAAMLTQQEKEAAQQQIAFRGQMSELQSRHESDIQHLTAAKSADSATLQSEVQMLRSQVSRENLEHNNFVQRQTESHQSMAKDLQNQISSLRQTIGEVRRAEQLLLQRDQLWSGLTDSMSVLASNSASSEAKHQAEMKSNQAREQLKRNAADLKSSGNSSAMMTRAGGVHQEREVADAVREAVAHSHQQLQGCLEELRAKQTEVQELKNKIESLTRENEQIRNSEKQTNERRLLAEQELAQARGEIQSLQVQASDASTAAQRSKELIEALVMNTVGYVGDVCNQFNIQVPRPSLDDLLSQQQQQQKPHHYHHQRSSSNSNNNNNDGMMKRRNSFNPNTNTMKIVGSAVSAVESKNTGNNDNNNSQKSSSSQNVGTGRRSSIVGFASGTPFDTPNASMIKSTNNRGDDENENENQQQSQSQIDSNNNNSPPRLVAPKFQPIELSPVNTKNENNNTAASTSSSSSSAVTTGTSGGPIDNSHHVHQGTKSRDDATNAAADQVLDDFAKRQKEILAKYGIKT